MRAKKCGLAINEHLEELANITSSLFPCEIFDNELTMNDSKEIPWHWHDLIELIYVRSGTLQLHCNEHTYTVDATQGAFINASVLHSASIIDKSCTFDSLLFHPNLLSNQSEYCYEQPFIQSVLNSSIECLIFVKEIPWQAAVLQHITLAFTHYEQEEFAFELYIHARLSDIWYAITHHAMTPLIKPDNNHNTVRIKQMIQFIQNNYQLPLTLQEIAASASVSERECLRCFHKKINSTPMQYVMKQRISAASHKLLQSDDAIENIARQVGFDSPSYFTYIFKRTTSLTPKAYRLARQNKTP